MYDIISLNEKSLQELKDIAKELDLKKVDRLAKQEIVYKILDHQALNPSPEILAKEKVSREPREKKPRKPVGGSNIGRENKIQEKPEVKISIKDAPWTKKEEAPKEVTVTREEVVAKEEAVIKEKPANEIRPGAESVRDNPRDPNPRKDKFQRNPNRANRPERPRRPMNMPVNIPQGDRPLFEELEPELPGENDITQDSAIEPIVLEVPAPVILTDENQQSPQLTESTEIVAASSERDIESQRLNQEQRNRNFRENQFKYKAHEKPKEENATELDGAVTTEGVLEIMPDG